jgi:hypothetical protein
MANVIHWTEIESFHNIRKFAKAYPENLKGSNTVKYRPKVKLHGTNAAVQVHADGSLVSQSRTQLLSATADNAGFAKWVIANETAWSKATHGFIYFGEWIGPGVQKGVACGEIPKKAFAVFAARPLEESDTLIVEPEELGALVGNVPDTYILPWYDSGIDVDWTASPEVLQGKVEQINGWVEAVEKNDPWVQETFNVNGTGEGLVFYPLSTAHGGVANFANLVFKAKGEKHKNIKTAAPAQVDASVAASIEQFVDMVLTDARLRQGVASTSRRDGSPSYDMKKIGIFIAWIVGDVQKETQDELTASNLEWKQVQKPIGDKARAWYLAKTREL